MVSFDELYAFIKKHRRHSRFEGRNSEGFWGRDYSKKVTQSYMDDLVKYGHSWMSRHEHNVGRGFKFDVDLNIDYGDEVVEYPSNTGNLTHLF
ncbi:hypothetical protein C5E18_11770 [Pectobacterium parmentieri]|uniref:hypothetical protein n=1 Tax=Pectobacterium parmentieri TaxID=1905730 RepID=UPI000F8EF067|nr:hypothetical protein [Pectobacterium parmentieri]AZS56751.1 hypothetical protein C5E18_11770 [Pectobacterium parmentieri]